jgi:ferritin
MSKRTKSKNVFCNDECIEILNYRIVQEEESSRLYHAMSIWLNDNGYMGAAKQWEKDSQDELKHALLAKNFLLDLGIQPVLPQLSQPKQKFTGLDQIIYESYDHELEVTNQCNLLANYAATSGNHLLYQLALKYVQEQQEELGKLQTLIDQLEAFGTDKIALRLLDDQLAAANV